MKYFRLNVTLTLTGPILTQSSTPGEPGIDSPVARSDNGQVILPFSLVKGRVRQSWCELFGDDAETWFGSKADGAYVPNRARFRFSDFVAAEGDRDGVKHRIRIDRRTGTADDGALQFIESPFAPGEEVEFRGEVSWFGDAGVSSEITKLEQAFRWTNNFGAERTTGFGRLTNVVCETAKELPPADAHAATEAVAPIRGLQIEMREPFCIARRQTSKNLFESDDIISGAVIRGVLATLFNQSRGEVGSAEINEHVPRWKILGEWFNSIRFTAAVPVAEGEANVPVAAPLSIVHDQKRQWHDVALCDAPIVFSYPDGGETRFRAPKFDVDWKKEEHQTVESDFGWTFPHRELRVRTAIESSTRRAKDEQLFAYEMVIPTGFRWHGTVDLSRVDADKRPQLLAELNALLSLAGTDGVQGFGKTKARARVVIGEPLPPRFISTLEPFADGLWIVALQSPALLCDPKNFIESTGDANLREAYAHVFDAMSDRTLQLVRYFARQSLAGGEYLHHRFQGRKPYVPFLLTDRGSVFVLRQTADATALLTDWLHHGLPLPTWAKERYGGEWKTNPFLPIDGFGTIAVNLPCHIDKKPEPGTFIEIAAEKGGA
jgi:RAMP superfamily